MDSSQEVEVIRTIYTTKLWFVATAALVVYESILTFSQEVQLIWGKRNLAAALFIFNRLAIIGWILSSVMWTQPMWNSEKSCAVQETLALASSLLLYCVWAVLSAARVRATAKSIPLALLTLLLGVAPVILFIVFQNIKITDVLVPVLDICSQNNMISKQAQRGQFLATRICFIASDVVALVTAWYRVYNPETMTFTGKGRYFNDTTASVLLHDGSVYFLIMTVTNTVIMGCYWYLLTENHSPAGDVVLILLTYCINPIQSIIISRFILGLSGVGHRGANGGISEMSQLPSFVQPQDPCRLPHALARLPATSFANTESRSQSGSNALCSSCGGQRSSGPLPAPTRESRVSQVEETPAYDSGADCDLFDEHVAEELGCNPTRAGDEEEGGISSP